MPIINETEWMDWVKSNNDPYGKCCVDVACEVMRLLDGGEKFDPHQIITTADNNIEAGGITGFMAGCVAQMVSHYHSRGEEFRKAWNGEVGRHTGQADSDGVLNPAIIHISV